MSWVDSLCQGARAQLWASFTRPSVEEIEGVEHQIGRRLPADFRAFYAHIGYGTWPRFGGRIYSPADMVVAIAAPIYFVLGSLFPGEEWATLDEHRRLWLSKGAYNPRPDRFTPEALTFRGLSLLDLLQVGTDGSAGYQVINLSRGAKTGYLVIFESSQVDFEARTFAEGIRKLTDTLVQTP